MSPFVRYSLRIPTDLHGALEKLAHDNRRSLHAEMIDRLWGSVNDDVLWEPGGKVAETKKGWGSVGRAGDPPQPVRATPELTPESPYPRPADPPIRQVKPDWKKKP